MLGSNDLMHYYDVDQIVSFMHDLIDSIDTDKVMILCPPIIQIDGFKEASIRLNEAYEKNERSLYRLQSIKYEF